MSVISAKTAALTQEFHHEFTMDMIPELRDTSEADPEYDANKPLSFAELFIIILSGHIGVRTRKQRAEDFDRANGLHVFIAAAVYFSLIVTGLIFLVIYIAG